MQEHPHTSTGSTASMISSSIAVLHEYSDTTSPSYIDDYAYHTDDDSVIQGQEFPSLDPELLDPVPAKENHYKPLISSSMPTA